MSSEMDQFKDLYVQSALDHLQELSDVLLKLESDHSQLDLVEQLMRAGHSLKGESGAMGFEQMATLGHVIEDLFTGIGNGTMQITEELVNTLFESIDRLKESVESVAANGTELPCEEYVTRIKAITGLQTEGFGQSGEAPEAAPAPVVPEAAPVAAAAPEPAAPVEVAPAPAAPIINAPLLGNAAAPTPAAAPVEVAPAPAPMSTGAPLSFDPAKLMHSSITTPMNEPVVATEVGAVAPASLEDIPMPVAQADGVTGTPAQGADVPAAPVAAPAAPAMPVAPVVAEDAPLVPPAKLEDIPLPTPQADGPMGTDPNAVASAASAAAPEPAAAVPSTAPVSSSPEMPATAEEVKKQTSVGNAQQISSVTIKVDKLDQMIGVSEELVLLKMKLKTNQIVQENSALKAEIHRLDRLVTDLQFYVMQTRLFPISMALHTVPRLVRDVAKKTNKKVRLQIEGEETTVDRTIIDHLTEPFVHMVRNAIDHGIEAPDMRLAIGKEEEAVLTMRAYTRENKFYVDISDDGAGIEWEKLAESAIKKGLITAEKVASLSTDNEKASLLFLDGVSTSEQITDISGRGVGMSAVQSAIKKLGGSISVQTQLGKGTTFTIRLPMTLAIMQSLLVGIGEQVFALPANEVSRTIQVEPEQIRTSANKKVIVVDEQEVFLHNLAEIFHVPDVEANPKVFTVVLVRQNEQLIGCIVDRIISEDEILVKPLGPLLKHSLQFSGSTILADGRAAPIINIEGLTWNQ